MSETMVCLRCGKTFAESDLLQIPYQEYPGAKVWHEDVSPCCQWRYEDYIDYLEAQEDSLTGHKLF